MILNNRTLIRKRTILMIGIMLVIVIQLCIDDDLIAIMIMR